MRMVKGLLLAGTLVLAPACSDHKDAEEPVTSDDKDDKAAEPAAEESVAAPTPPPAPPSEIPEPAAAAPAPAAAPAAAAPAAAAAPVEPDGFGGPKVKRSVRVVAIKVHTLPDKASPVLGWVKKGDVLEVVINGDWAKLGPGRYISNKFLTDQAVAPAAPAAAPAKAAKPGK